VKVTSFTGLPEISTSRPPTPDELTDANSFLAGQRALYGAKDPKGDERAWADFAHVLFNVKEFIYLN